MKNSDQMSVLSKQEYLIILRDILSKDYGLPLSEEALKKTGAQFNRFLLHLL